MLRRVTVTHSSGHLVGCAPLRVTNARASQPFQRAVGVRRVQRLDAGDGLKLELAHVRVNDREALLAQHHAVGESQAINVALRTAGPGA